MVRAVHLLRERFHGKMRIGERERSWCHATKKVTGCAIKMSVVKAENSDYRSYAALAMKETR